MQHLAYVNGDIVPLAEARISVLDRGFLFADGVYEVTAILGGRLVDLDSHMARLRCSLRELDMTLPEPPARIAELHHTLIERSGVAEGLIYLQVTSGAGAERDFLPPPAAKPSLVMFTQAKALIDNPAARTGISVLTVPDLRWARRDIKSVALLAQVWAKRQAAAAGCAEAWMVEDGSVTEGASSNAYIVQGDTIVTRQNGHAILPGCTRAALLALARERQMRIEERAFTPAEALAADEAFSTSATAFVLPVVRIDGKAVGDGTPGQVATRLRALYVDFARAPESAIEDMAR
jgi:D-alanine transaminase